MKNFNKLAILAILSFSLGCSKPKPIAIGSNDQDRIIAADSVQIKAQIRMVLSKAAKPNGDSIHSYIFGLKSEDGNEVLRLKDEF